MSVENNIRVFEDTCNLCMNHPKLKDKIQKSREKQKLIYELEILPDCNKQKYDCPAQIIVSKKRTYEVAADYKGKKVCVLNFASAVNPGGGVVHGGNSTRRKFVQVFKFIF